jgi:hypothetical protein
MWVGEQRKKCRNTEMIFGMGDSTDWSPLCVACRGLSMAKSSPLSFTGEKA